MVKMTRSRVKRIQFCLASLGTRQMSFVSEGLTPEDNFSRFQQANPHFNPRKLLHSMTEAIRKADF